MLRQNCHPMKYGNCILFVSKPQSLKALLHRTDGMIVIEARTHARMNPKQKESPPKRDLHLLGG